MEVGCFEHDVGKNKRAKKNHKAIKRAKKSDLNVMWKNVQSLKGRARQVEFNAWMIGCEMDIMGVCETWLKGDEFVKMDNQLTWIGRNRGTESLGGGGVGFCLNNKSNLVFEKVLKEDIEDVLMLKVKRKGNKKWELLFGVVYFEVEGRQGGWEKNKKIADFIIQEVEKAKQEGLKIFIGGDLNGHICELDGHDNRNGEIVKGIAENGELEILNCIMEHMDAPTWERGELKYRLDYCLTCGKGLESTKKGEIMEIGVGVGKDHAGVKITIEASDKGNIITQKGKSGKVRVLRNADWDFFGTRVDEEVGNERGIGEAIKEVVEEMSAERNDERKKGRRWEDEELVKKIESRMSANKEHRRKYREYGEGSAEQIRAWDKYQEAKAAVQHVVREKMREEDVEAMRAIKESKNKSKELWKHLKGTMGKNRTRNQSEIVKLTNLEGEEITREEDLRKEISRVWGDLFCTEGEASIGIDKESSLEGLVELRNVDEEELQMTLNRLRNGKAVGEDDVAGEYLKALKAVGREQLGMEINSVFNGGEIPISWKRSRVLLIPKGPKQDDVKNYRPIAIISVICKVAMMIMRNRLNEAVEDTNFLGDIQGGFRKNRRTEDNLFVLERIIETCKQRGDKLFLGFLDLEKAYDRVNRGKLFDILKRYGIGCKFVEVIENIYKGSEVKFIWKGVETEWVETKSGVRQGCPLSPLLFNLYVREIGRKIENSGLGVTFPIVEDNEQIKQWINVAGLMYADDIVLIAKSREDMQTLLTSLDDIALEYGLSFSEKKSKVIRINEECKDETWRLNGKEIKEDKTYKYLGIQIKGGVMGGMDAMEERLKECRRVVGMIKFSSNRAGDRLLVGREAWKGMAVSKLMYGSGAIAGELKHIQCMDTMQNDMGRWLWRSGQNVSNALIRGEIGWSTFKEREAKVKLDWMRRIIFEEGLVSQIGRATAAELGTVSKWWRRVDEIANMVGLEDLMNILALKFVNKEGLARLDLSLSEKVWKAKIINSVETWGMSKWRERMGNSNEMLEYRSWKSKPGLEDYVNGGDGARVRMLLRGGYLPVRGNEKFTWRNRNTMCKCGEVETTAHWLFVCRLYEEERNQWEDSMMDVELLKGYTFDKGNNNKAIKYLERMWRLRQEIEKDRED